MRKTGSDYGYLYMQERGVLITRIYIWPGDCMQNDVCWIENKCDGGRDRGGLWLRWRWIASIGCGRRTMQCVGVWVKMVSDLKCMLTTCCCAWHLDIHGRGDRNKLSEVAWFLLCLCCPFSCVICLFSCQASMHDPRDYRVLWHCTVIAVIMDLHFIKGKHQDTLKI